MSPLRVAVLCDFAEENWPSMDLVASMLLDRLNAGRSGRPRARGSSPYETSRGALAGSEWASTRTGYEPLLGLPAILPSLPAFDLFHVIDHSYAQLVHRLAPERTIVTCHDIDTFRCLLQPAAERRPLWFRAMVRRTLTGLKRPRPSCASAMPPASSFCITGRAAPARSRRPQRRPPAVHLRAGSQLGYRRGAIARPAGTHARSAARRQHHSPQADRRPSARFRGLFTRRPGLRLVRVGSPLTAAQQDLAKALGLQDSILCLPALNAEMLAAVYRRAALVLIPSEAEGFGLPLAEAMACGTPVVASAIPALREVAGGAAVHCPVGAIEDWTEAVLTLLQQREFSPAEWRTRISGGCARAGAFTWDRNAAAMIDIYKTTLSRMEQD